MKRVTVLLLSALTLSSAAAAPFEYDLVLANGRVADGTGAPWFRADVGIRGDRIAALGNLSAAKARRRIDVGGRMVAPGFIDMLGGSGLAVLVDNRLESKVRQGITTEITGEGRELAPLDDALIEEIKLYVDRFGLKIDWRDLDGYVRRFENAKSTINIAAFASATNLRLMVLGSNDVKPGPEQLRKMESLLERAMAQGALGLSSALIYPPATYADREELTALARVAARHGGVYATHLRSEAHDLFPAVDEAIAIGRDAAIPVEIWHLKASGRSNWGRMREVLERIERARAEGVDVTADVYPYDAAANELTANIPAWAQAGGRKQMLERLQDSTVRERIKAELWRTAVGDETPDRIQVFASPRPEVKPYLGLRISEISERTGRTPEEALLHLVEISEGAVGAIRYVMSEDDVRLALSRPWVSLCTDSAGKAIDGPFAGESAHPRGFGSMPRVLGHYVREVRLFSIEDAVRKMTSLPARRVGLYERGLLRPGMFADITVFDPERIRDVATFENPTRYSEGVDYVVVNGRVVLDAGRMSSERPGRFLRRGREGPFDSPRPGGRAIQR
ncbi:MAG TPA: D-aminoacylase [Myxococcaceae bacterium]|nr:D-aminoacylase [Myxococcaceae bacterium]